MSYLISTSPTPLPILLSALRTVPAMYLYLEIEVEEVRLEYTH